MKRALWLGLLVAGVLAGVAAWRAATQPRWSVRDAEVLALVEKARGELGKLYYREAAELLQQAVRKAPEAFAPRYFLARALWGLGRGQEAREQVDLLRQLPPERLTAQERMLLELLVLRRSGDREAYVAKLLEYQKAQPREVELARLLALAYQEAGQPEQAAHWGRKTLELDANDAFSYNILGYAALAQGRFAEAEEQFRKYAFIAPDQANPHDSLGELFLITGRYGEAEAELRRAAELNPRFYPAWRHLADLFLFTGKLEDMRQAVGQLASALDLPRVEAKKEEAVAVGLFGFFHHQPELLLRAAAALPEPKDEWEVFVVHAGALARGELANALAWEAALEQVGLGPRSAARLRPLLEAHRTLRLQQAQEVVARTAQVLAKTSYVNVAQAWTRLVALCWQAQALRQLGQHQQAQAALQEVSTVNPRFPLLSQELAR